MTEPLLLIGGGGHALVVGETVLALRDRFSLIGFVDPDPTASTATRLGVPCLGDDAAARKHPSVALALGVGGVGGVGHRPAIVERYGEARRWPTLVHPSAYVSPSADLGRGVVVLPSAVVHAGARVGDFSLVNTGAVVEHDVVLGRHAIVGPRATVGGATVVGDRVSVGLGANLRDNIRIGSEAVIAMGAVVVAHVPAGIREFGVGARRPESKGDE